MEHCHSKSLKWCGIVKEYKEIDNKGENQEEAWVSLEELQINCYYFCKSGEERAAGGAWGVEDQYMLR